MDKCGRYSARQCVERANKISRELKHVRKMRAVDGSYEQELREGEIELLNELVAIRQRQLVLAVNVRNMRSIELQRNRLGVDNAKRN